MERSHSGLVRHLGRVVWGKLHRGFESLSLRQERCSHTRSGMAVSLLEKESNTGSITSYSRRCLHRESNAGSSEAFIPSSPPHHNQQAFAGTPGYFSTHVISDQSECYSYYLTLGRNKHKVNTIK